jgi:large subunit ribosomal protein L25
MANVTAITAELRERAGKGAARATRRAGRVPAVIYGNKEKSVMISMDPSDLMQQLRGPGFFSHVFEISVNGDKHRVLARDLQLHPVTERPLHVDFMRFSADTKVNVDVQVVFENEEESPGLKRGGVLNVVRHAVEFVCPADRIPERITVDLTGLEIGDSVHISDVSVPDEVEPTITDRDFTIATIAAPSVLKTPEEEAAEAAEAEALLLEGEEGEAVEGEEGEGEAKPEGEEGKGEADAESKE